MENNLQYVSSEESARSLVHNMLQSETVFDWRHLKKS